MASSQSPEAEEPRRIVRLGDEAVVPDQLTKEELQRRLFINNNSYHRPEDLLDVFNYSGYVTPFDTKEQLVFAQAFKKTPKNFGAIAESLPGRTVDDCVKYYNARRGDGRFKSQTELQWTNKQAMKENMYAYEDDAPPPPPPKPVVSGKKGQLIDEHIKKLRGELEDQPQSLYTQKARAAQKVFTLARPDLAYLHKGFRAPLDIGNDRIIKFLRSANVLPLIKQWTLICIDNPRFKAQMEAMLPAGFSWDIQLEEIAADAPLHKDSNFELDQVLDYRHVYVFNANWAYKIAAANRDYFEGGLFKPYGFELIDRMTVGVAALFTAYEEVTKKKDNSFFVTLLASPLAKPMYRDVRETWEAKYKFEGEKELGPPVNRDIGPRPAPQLPTSVPPSQLSVHTSTRRELPARSHNHRIGKAAKSGEYNGTEEDEGSESDSSESDDGFGEPGDEAGRIYKAKAEGLYNALHRDGLYKALKNVEAELKEVTAERDHYKAKYEEDQGELQADRGTTTGSDTQPTSTPVQAVVMDPKMAKDAKERLKFENEKLEHALKDQLQGKAPEMELSLRTKTDDAVKALLHAGYTKKE